MPGEEPTWTDMLFGQLDDIKGSVREVKGKVEGISERQSDMAADAAATGATVRSIEDKISTGDQRIAASVVSARELLQASIASVGAETARAHTRIDGLEANRRWRLGLWVGIALALLAGVITILAQFVHP